MSHADPLEYASRILTRVAFAVAAMTALAAPMLALEFGNRPFLGFFVDATVVVNDLARYARPPVLESLVYPDRVVRISGDVVRDIEDFDRAVASREIGDEVTVFVETPEGDERLIHPVELTTFPSSLMSRLFALPYLIGVAYLGIGLWVSSVQGHTRPGRALSFFCACTAVVTMLIFDLSSTHALVHVWTLAIPLCGGALISMALRFPVEWSPVVDKPWLLALPYLLALGLAFNGMAAVESSDPWRYAGAWALSYRFTAFGILVFLASTLYSARRSTSSLVRRQGRIVLWGSLVSFLPITFWFLAPVVGLRFPFDALALLPWLLVFPVAVAVAIVRYRLFEMDTLVNRTVVYGALTAVLAGLYSASIGLSQRVFIALTGERSDAAIVITTLIVASAFTPVRTWLQAVAEKELRDPAQQLRRLTHFGSSVRSFTDLADPNRRSRRMLTEVAETLGASTGILRIGQRDRWTTTHTYGEWRGSAVVSFPLTHEGRAIGILQLGPRQDGSPYSQRQVDAAAELVTRIAGAVTHHAPASTGRTSPLIVRKNPT